MRIERESKISTSEVYEECKICNEQMEFLLQNYVHIEGVGNGKKRERERESAKIVRVYRVSLSLAIYIQNISKNECGLRRSI